MSSPLRGFLAKNQKKNFKYGTATKFEESQFPQKMLSYFQKTHLKKLMGGKYAGGYQLIVLVIEI